MELSLSGQKVQLQDPETNRPKKITRIPPIIRIPSWYSKEKSSNDRGCCSQRNKMEEKTAYEGKGIRYREKTRILLLSCTAFQVFK